MEGLERNMQAGNSKHAAWRDEQLDHDTRPLTSGGPGAGRADAGRDPEPVADEDLGVLTGIRWLESADTTSHTDVQPLATSPALAGRRRRRTG